jgi:hypothetical protein
LAIPVKHESKSYCYKHHSQKKCEGQEQSLHLYFQL